ncbi:hypothetical protein VPH35_017236 [Triticum aestivum]
MDLPGAGSAYLPAPPPGLRALAVSADAVRLSSIAANLRERWHYEGIRCLLRTASCVQRLLSAGRSPSHRATVQAYCLRCGSVVVNMLAVCLFAVTACIDQAAAMAELRAGNKFEVVLVDMHSLGCGAPAIELLECAVGGMHVETYAISESGHRFGPLVMEDLDVLKKHNDNEASNGSKSLEATQNGPCNSSP